MFWRCFVLYSTAVFCTGARDGNIMVWDTRCSKKGIGQKIVFELFCPTQFLWDFRLNLWGHCRILGSFHVWQCLWPCFCRPPRWFLQTSETDQRRSQQGGGEPPHQDKEEAGQRTRHGSLCGEFLPKLTETLPIFNQPINACPQSPPLRPNTPPCRFWGSYINYRHRAVLINYLNIILVYYLAAIDKVCELVAATIVFLYSENWDWKHTFCCIGRSLSTRSFLQDSQQSVTVVLFRDQHTLISSGAVDG